MKFERGREVPGGSVLTTDVCVIGSGAAGITVARELDGSSLQVLVLEAGGLEHDPVAEADTYAIDQLGIPYLSTIPNRGRWFGGSTSLWFGRIAMLDPIDLEARAWVRDSGWPLTIEQLHPWVPRAAAILDVPHIEKLKIQNWPQNPTIDTFAGTGGAGLGVFLWADGMFMGERQRARLEASPNVRVLLDATATQFVPNEGSSAIDTLEVCGAPGTRFSVRASTYVLAAGGLENPRLLLASTARSPEGVGNGEDLVGRYYLDHPRGEGLATVDLRNLAPGQIERLLLLGEKSKSEYGKVQLRVTFPEALQRDESLLNHSLHAHLVAEIHNAPGYIAARRLVERLRNRQQGARGDVRADAIAVAKGGPQLLRLGARQVRGRSQPSELVVIDQMEQEPDPDSRVTVDHRRLDRYGLPRLQVDWRVGSSTYRSQRRMHRMFGDILGRVGITTFRSQVLERPDEQPEVWDMKHPSGTTRMSNSPKHGVVDADSRVHGLANLYVAGSSTFPTAGHANPTLLIVALAARLADHLRRTAPPH